MTESMRGSRLGAVSYEVEGAVAPRTFTTFVCPQGHRTTVPFAAEAEELPPGWDCACGALATREGATLTIVEPLRRPRTHWDILLERRTVPELEVLLAERLELLRDTSARSA